MMRRPRLRTLLLLSNLLVLALPLSGLWALRLYESALIRQTEAELRAQAAVLAGTWRAARGLAGESLANGLTPFGLQTARRQGLDLGRDPVLPVAPPARPGPAAAPEAADTGARLLPVLRDAQVVTLAALRLLDPQGVVVASTGADTGLSLAGMEEVEAARAGQAMSVLRRRERVAAEVPGGISRTAGFRVFLALPVLDGTRVDAVVLLSRTPPAAPAAVAGKLPEIAAVASLLLLLVTVLALGASRLVTGPLAAVVAAARRVASGAATPLPHVGPFAVREAAELAEAIGRMTRTLEGRATYVRSLAAHVSHEFKTPLAALRGAAELLDEHGDVMSPAERRRFTAGIGTAVLRLDRLIAGLLELARADMAGGGSGSTILRPLALAAAARFPALRVSVGGAATAVLPPGAVDSVLDCLLGNVLLHAGAGSTVSVTLREADGLATMRVADDGPGLSASNALRAFDPFFTTARDAGGTGLGLPIARALIEGAGGTIALSPSAAGACFTVVLPAKPEAALRD